MTNIMTFTRHCVTRTNYTTLKFNKVIVILTLLEKKRRLSVFYLDKKILCCSISVLSVIPYDLENSIIHLVIEKQDAHIKIYTTTSITRFHIYISGLPRGSIIQVCQFLFF